MRYTIKYLIDSSGKFVAINNKWAYLNVPVVFLKVNTTCDHVIINDSSKSTWLWGNNEYGQIGDNTIIKKTTPVSVSGVVKTFCQISVGVTHTSSIDKNGKVWCWGYNQYGKLGDNSLTSRLTPVSILGVNKTFCQITNGTEFTSSIDKNGKVWSWGYNQYGQLGDNSVTSRRTPVSILGVNKTFCQITNGSAFTSSIDQYGKVWSWGYNQYGQLGDNSITTRRTPVIILGVTKTFCKISTGASHTVGIDKNGIVWCWGYGVNGQLGYNSTTSQRTPVSILGVVKTFCQINCGQISTLGIDKNGKIWGWGSNIYGQLGNNSVVAVSTPVAVQGTLKTFCSIASGNSNTFAIDYKNNLWGWGYGKGLGLNIPDYITPTSIVVDKTFCKITAGDTSSLGIDKNGKIWGWGDNSFGQLGDNSTTNRFSPVSISGVNKTFCNIYTGDNHSVGIDKNGKAWGWGSNSFGRLGDNTTASKSTPVAVAGVTKTFCNISAGLDHSNSIDKNGKIWSWGNNALGQLGDNSITSKNTPISVVGVNKTFCKIVAGQSFSGSIDKNGRVWTWGNNSVGQLGNNSITSERTPVSILGVVKTFCFISMPQYATNTNAYRTSSIDKDGKIWSWGGNNNGVLGDNSGVSKRTPVLIAGVTKTFCKISCGGLHSLAIDKYGKIWSWGNNTYGQLGDGTITQRNTPVSIIGTTKTFCEITAGLLHSIGIDKNGTLWTWGQSTSGQIGYVAMYLTPVSISF
jgi:alpha-tubulin suppressor-like RCC1 family protein